MQLCTAREPRMAVMTVATTCRICLMVFQLIFIDL